DLGVRGGGAGRKDERVELHLVGRGGGGGVRCFGRNMINVYAAFIRGQGGALTSPGMDAMAAQARSAGIAADVFDYEDVAGIEAAIAARHDEYTALTGIGYSLGGSTVTY